MGNMQEDTIQDTKKTSVPCNGCENNAIFNVFTLKVPGQPDQMVQSFQCDSCGIKENSIIPNTKETENSLFISCKVFSQEDLGRYISIFSNSDVNFKIKDLDNFKTFEDYTGTIDTLVVNIIDRLSPMYGFKVSTAMTDDELKKTSSTSLVEGKTSSSTSSSSSSSKKSNNNKKG